jgi:hypothetical protein
MSLACLMAGWRGCGVAGGFHVLCGKVVGIWGIVGGIVSRRFAAAEGLSWCNSGAWLVMNRAWTCTRYDVVRASQWHVHFGSGSSFHRSLHPPQCLALFRRISCC